MTSLAVLDLMRDPFGDFFAGSSWDAWRVCLAADRGLPCPDVDGALELFGTCTGRTNWPTKPARRKTRIIGRRGGKDRINALEAIEAACFRQHRLAIGERGVVLVVAVDKDQGRITFRYIRDMLHAVPMLKALIIGETRETISLSNKIDIEVRARSFRRIRGRTIVHFCGCETAFWESDELAADPDVEILNAVEPAMLTVPDASLVLSSSPYARRGVLWTDFEAYFGEDDADVFVWKSPTWVMNPCVDRAVIDRAYADDEARAGAEYGSEFRRDIERLLSIEAIRAVVHEDRRELPRASGVAYSAFVDPSGGSQDAMTLAIAHIDAKTSRVVLDAIRVVRPPFSPEAVVTQFAQTLTAYGCHEVRGDAYGGEWPRELFRKAGITYLLSLQPRTELYSTFVPLVNADRVELLDDPALVKEIVGLERRMSKTGRESITHGPKGHDDIANAVAGAIVHAKRGPRGPVIGTWRWGLD